jgi:mRNA interferase MazF
VSEQDFDKWNEIKKDITYCKIERSFKTRDIFYIKMGQNVGVEQNGKGKEFVRPVVIIKKITKDMFIGVPLSTQLKDGSWFYKFNFNKSGKTSHNIAIIPQVKMYSSKRLLNRIGKMKLENFEELKQKIKDFID